MWYVRQLVGCLEYVVDKDDEPHFFSGYLVAMLLRHKEIGRVLSDV